MNKPGQCDALNPLWELGTGLLWRPLSKAPPFGRGSFTKFGASASQPAKRRNPRWIGHRMSWMLQVHAAEARTSIASELKGCLFARLEPEMDSRDSSVGKHTADRLNKIAMGIPGVINECGKTQGDLAASAAEK